MRLKDHIAEQNISISDLSKESGLPYTTVNELVNGKKTLARCSAETVYRLALALDTTVEGLLVAENDSGFGDRYSLTRSQSIFLAKKLWDENVYCGMRMESRNVTFPQTKTIIEGVNVPGVSIDDITAILNMRDAWKYLLNSVDDRLDLTYICKLNSFISRNEALEWGVLRYGRVGISGTDYVPPVPVREKVESDIRKITSAYEPATSRALELFCYITYNQLFWDGNKRTALVAANKLLITKGCGFLTIKDKDMPSFNDLLAGMYSTGNNEDLKRFLYDNAVLGLEL
ncbi:MAG: helix-turn-helix domain-containing protein [Spirochaetales bacterium]|nr:helix-turn-helix domain-containing protein [Spirochaetales bacterium]